MTRAERQAALKKLDDEQGFYRAMAQKACHRTGWLREIRMVLGVPAPEMARKLGTNRSEIFRVEVREARKRITLETLERMAEALDCRLVYAVVPKKGTLADLSLKRAWDSLFGEDGEKKFKQMMRLAAWKDRK